MSTVLYLNRRDAAKACGVSVDMIDAASKAGRLKGKKNRPADAKRENTKVVFSPEALKAWVESWDDT